MTKFAIAETYEEVLDFFQERIRFYSGERWSMKSEHDPGLTTVQLLANAVALLEDEYHALPGRPSLFNDAPRSPWQPIQIKDGVPRSNPDFTSFTAQDFKTLPAVSEDIIRMAESVPGVKRAWIQKANQKDIALLLEFAAVMPRAKGGNETSEYLSDKQKQSILRLVCGRLKECRGFCQPELPVREAVPHSLTMWLELQGNFHKTGGEQMQKKDVTTELAAVMEAVGEFLHPGTYLKKSFYPAELLVHFGGMTAVTCGIINDGIDRSFSGHEQVTLPDGKDVFMVRQWRFSLEYADHFRDATPAEILMAKYIYDARSVHEAWTGQWFGPVEQHGSAKTKGQNVIHLPAPARADKIMLHKQFPACYRLDENDEKSSEQILQMQGWLLLFEQLLADMAIPLDSPERYFKLDPLEPADFVGNIGHPLLSKLSVAERYQEALEASTAEDEYFLQLPRRTMLLHFAALQGEAGWFNLEDKKEQAEETLHDDDISLWLHRLACYNGQRLSRGRSLNEAQYEFEGGILEERLAMLLSQLCPLASTQSHLYYFYTHKELNPITAKVEYRCAIMDRHNSERIICNVMSPNSIEAKRIATMALRLARLSCHYSLDDETVRLGSLAQLPGTYSSQEALVRIGECQEWAKNVLLPWVRVLDYKEIDAAYPYCLIVFMAEEDVPQKYRDTLTDAIQQHIPAHLSPYIFFLSSVDRREVNKALRSEDAGFFIENRILILQKIIKKIQTKVTDTGEK